MYILIGFLLSSHVRISRVLLLQVLGKVLLLEREEVVDAVLGRGEHFIGARYSLVGGVFGSLEISWSFVNNALIQLQRPLRLHLTRQTFLLLLMHTFFLVLEEWRSIRRSFAAIGDLLDAPKL